MDDQEENHIPFSRALMNRIPRDIAKAINKPTNGIAMNKRSAFGLAGFVISFKALSWRSWSNGESLSCP